MALGIKSLTVFGLTVSFLYWPSANADLSRRIEEAALNGLENVVEHDGVRTLYGAIINGEDTAKGKFACAKVVAATVKHAGTFIPRRVKGGGKGLALAVWEVEEFARRAGWHQVGDTYKVLPGDIVIYKKLWNFSGDCTSGGGTCHVGIMTREGLFHNHPLKGRPHLGGGGLMLYTFKTAYRP